MAERRFGLLHRPDGGLPLPVSIHGDVGDHDVVEYLSIEGRSGPNGDSDLLVISPGTKIRAVGQPEAGFQKVEVVEETKGPVVLFIPVSETVGSEE